MSHNDWVVTVEKKHLLFIKYLEINNFNFNWRCVVWSGETKSNKHFRWVWLETKDEYVKTPHAW